MIYLSLALMLASGGLSLYYHGNAKEFAAMSFSMERVAETQWLGLLSKPWSAAARPDARSLVRKL